MPDVGCRSDDSVNDVRALVRRVVVITNAGTPQSSRSRMAKAARARNLAVEIKLPDCRHGVGAYGRRAPVPLEDAVAF